MPVMARDIGKEVIKALAVLALIFLSFGHQPIDIAPTANGDSGWTLADLSYCGAPPGEDSGGHLPCHACRVGGAALPPPPCAALDAPLGFTRAAFGAYTLAFAPRPVVTSTHPRAPPRPA